MGLFCLMAQCGLHVPCAAGSVLPLVDAVYCDIGDSQSLTQNLSTFSGHLTRVMEALNSASRDSLVLLDELGSAPIQWRAWALLLPYWRNCAAGAVSFCPRPTIRR